MKNTVSLNQNRDFLRLYKRGSSIVSKNIVLYYRKNKEERNRLGITVSKRIGKAVIRNRAKRIIKESYRNLEPSMKNGYDMVIVARTAINGKKMWEILESLEKSLKKAGIYSS